jgi:adenine phosphoribosyltransferase
MDYKKHIAVIEDFPTKGISFKDITTLTGNGEAYYSAIKEFSEFSKSRGATVIVGPESRGFIFGCPVAFDLKVPFVPVRKPGKLPREEITEDYSLEYGKNTLCMHKDAIKTGDKVVIIDDLLATGGTIDACCRLINRLGGEVVGICFLIELTDLKGRQQLKNQEILSLVKYTH